MKEIQPVNQHVLLELTQVKEQKTSGGIIIPDTVKEKPSMGRVISMSNIDNPEIVAGDTVLFKKFAGTETEIDGNSYMLVPYADILAKIVDTEEI